ncbi:helix-turn-helix transcriptional regulator [Pelomonas sp. KK5]|uniref:helix-turn-helix transcriptional regulator n=1 Tax=Pelomonas sp. KK5 TaxID=1855730 RepID=UPI00097BBF9F|nr:helix-turn-helix transcriptional regulator [Pelomonas sp. KK5]
MENSSAAEEFDDVVAGLYEAAVHPQRWQASLSKLAAWSGSDVFHFLCWDPMAQSAPFNVFTEGIPQSNIDIYNQHYWSVDPRRRLIDNLSVGEMTVCQHHFSDRFVSGSEFFQDYLLPVVGQRYTWFTRPLIAGNHDVLLAMMRMDDRGAFGGGDILRSRRMVPHLQRAVKLWVETEPLREAGDVGREAAVAAGLALFGLDGAGRIVHANGHAEAMLRDAQHLVQRGAVLQAAHDGDAARLRETLANVGATGLAQRFSITSRSGEPNACFLTISALPADAPLRSRLGTARVLVMARRPGHAVLPANEQLASLFGLTRAESAVALALASGRTPDEYASEAGVGISTVRTHMRAVFDKTYTRRQADLVRLLLLLQHG